MPIPPSILSLLLGLSRVLLPIFYLQIGFAPPWLPSLAHLAHHLSFIAGTSIGPSILSSRLIPLPNSPHPPNFHSSLLLFISSALKFFCLLLFTTLLFLHFSPLLFLFPIFGIGFSDGIAQRHLLIDALKRGKHELIQILIQFSAASLFAVFSIGPTLDGSKNENGSHFPAFIPQMPFQFSIHPKMLFGGLALFQVILLFPLFPLPSKGEEGPTAQNSPISIQTHEMAIEEESIPRPSIGFPLLAPLCLIGAFSSSLLEGIPFALLPFTNSNEFDQNRDYLLLFSAFSLAARLCLALFPSPRRPPSPNALFPIGLFGSGLALCTLNAPSPFRQFAFSLYGSSLALLLPALLLSIPTPAPNSPCPPPSLLPLLIASQLGPLLFPVILAQIFSAYGGPQLYTPFALLAVLFMVIAFVCLLNAQAENLRATKKGNLLEWFRGNGGKRTRRSIRRFVRNVRGSLRRQKPALGYNRCQKRRRIGTADLILLEENNEGNGGQMRANYQSIQGPEGDDWKVEGQQKGEEESEEAKEGGLLGALALRRARFAKFSLPAIIVHQGTPNSQSTKSLQSILNAARGQRHCEY